MTNRLSYLDPDPTRFTFGTLLVCLIVICLGLGFVAGLFAGAVLMGGF